MTIPTEQSTTRRARYKEETRADLSRVAFDLAVSQGLTNVRVPEIAAAAGVSTRTFNNYFSSKEEAIVWPATERAGRLAAALREQSVDAPLRDSLVVAMTSLYKTPAEHGLAPQWLRGFRALVAAEPALHGEYLKASDAAERALADALIERMGAVSELESRVLAAMVTGAERAAVLQWMLHHEPSEKLVDVVRAALEYALAGVGRKR